MKKIISKLFISILFAAAAFAQNDMQPLVIVKYNKAETITLRQLKKRAAFVSKQYGMETLPIEQKRTLLDNLIYEKLLCQAAAKEGYSVSDSQVDSSFLASFSQQLGREVSETELAGIIKQQTGKSLDEYIREMSGMTLSEYKAYLKSQLIVQNLVAQKKQSEISSVAATDEEIRNAYEMNKSTFRWDEMMKLFLVMVPKGSNDMAAKALCEDMRNQYVKDPKKSGIFMNAPENGKGYQAGELFIAKTAQQAQVLRWSEDKLRELFSHPEKYIGETTETANDFQFYVILKKYDAKLLGLSDVVQPETTITVYDSIKGNLTQQKQMQYFVQAAQDMAKELTT